MLRDQGIKGSSTGVNRDLLDQKFIEAENLVKETQGLVFSGLGIASSIIKEMENQRPLTLVEVDFKLERWNEIYTLQKKSD